MSKKAIDGQSADVFALGVILFSMIFGQKPFYEASLNDKHYNYIAENQCDEFWNIHQKSMADKNKFISHELKDLIMSMLQYDQVRRISVTDIFGHPWL